MDPVRSLYIGPRMGHVIIYCTGWVLDGAPRTKETLSIFFSKLWILVNGTSQYGIRSFDIHEFSAS